MNEYLITFTDGTAFVVEAVGTAGAQEVACDMCDEAGIVFGEIVSIKRVDMPFRVKG